MKTFTHSENRLPITGLCVGDRLTYRYSREQVQVITEEKCQLAPCSDCRSNGYYLRCSNQDLVNIYRCGTGESLWKEIPDVEE